MLLEALIEQPVQRLVVASSMSLYGEGLYRDAPAGAARRRRAHARSSCGAATGSCATRTAARCTPVPTPETKAPALASVYALSKYDQERLCLMIGRAYSIPTVALRFFNVYGPRQALSNPYTGVLAIFASRLLNDSAPLIFEDGLQQRDFVSVYDVARACRLALETPAAAGEVFNVGSGEPHTVREIAARLAQRRSARSTSQPEITGKYRVGDIRHCFADIAQGAARPRLRAAGRRSTTAWPNSRPGSRARPRSTAWRRPAPSSRRGG